MTVLEKGLGPLKSLNQLTSRLRFSWDLKALDDGRTALRVNDVVVLEGIFLNDADGKNFVASAALAAISRVGLSNTVQHFGKKVFKVSVTL